MILELLLALASVDWTRNGLPAEAALEEGCARLSFEQSGVRWAADFSTEEAQTARLWLDWRPGPDGCLFEIILDGQPLSPLRDAWRPTSRDLQSDLGSIWLGKGSHRVEFVCREEAPGAALRVAALQLRAP